jgi:hypothetical protein
MDRLSLRGRGDTGSAVSLIEATETPMPLSPIHTPAPLPSWHRGRIVVIGDAAPPLRDSHVVGVAWRRR